MDKYYNFIKIEQVKELLIKDRLEEAVEIAASINTERIKNPADLNSLAEVYLRAGMLTKARESYLVIYEKCKSRRVVMQLVNIAVRLKNIDEAERFYNEFIKLAPGDFYCYIFRYSIDKMEGKPYQTLINSLQKLKKVEYIDTWAYELAKLYHKAGDKDKCIAECEDIIIWFGDGEAVDRARALRGYYLGELDLNSMAEGTYNTDDDSEDDVEEKTEEVSAMREEEKTEEASAIYEEERPEEASVIYEEERPEEASAIYEEEKPEEENDAELEVERALTEMLAREEELLRKSVLNELGVSDETDNEEQPTAEKLASEQVMTKQQPAAEQLEAEQVMTKQPAAEQLEAEQVTIKQPAAEQLEAEQATKKQPAEERPSAEKSKEERALEAEEELRRQKLYEAGIELPDEDIAPASTKAEYRVETVIQTPQNKVTEAQSAQSDETQQQTWRSQSVVSEGAMINTNVVSHDRRQRNEVPINENGFLAKFLNEKLVDLEDYFDFFAYHENMRTQLIKTLELLLNPQIRNICLIISGERRSGKKKIISGITRILNQGGILSSQKQVLTEGRIINNLNIIDKQEQLLGKCFIINDAGELNSRTADQLLKLNEFFAGRTMVVLTDTRSRLSRMFRDNRELNSMFPNRIHIPEFSYEDLIDFTYLKLDESGYSLDKEAEMLMMKQIRELQRKKQEGKLAMTAELVRRLLEVVENRNARAFLEQTVAGLQARKSNIITRDDFEEMNKNETDD